jgi:acetyl-CoA carboxylase carboxyl transferase subunit alpha
MLARDAAASLKLRASDLAQMGLIDGILPEPLGGAHRNHVGTASTLRAFVVRALSELLDLPREVLLTRRDARLRGLGQAVQSAV